VTTEGSAIVTLPFKSKEAWVLLIWAGRVFMIHANHWCPLQGLNFIYFFLTDLFGYVIPTINSVDNWINDK
jgi:hypothetical protein